MLKNVASFKYQEIRIILIIKLSINAIIWGSNLVLESLKWMASFYVEQLTACFIFFAIYILASCTATCFSASNCSMCLESVCSLCCKVYNPTSRSLMCRSPKLISIQLPCLMAAFPCWHSPHTITCNCSKSSWPHNTANSLNSRSRLQFTTANNLFPRSCNEARNSAANVSAWAYHCAVRRTEITTSE